MKQYFAKYIPVEGEIRDGDTWALKSKPEVKMNAHIIRGKIGCDNYKFAPRESSEGQLYRLYLCSRDIQVGDKVKTCQTKDDFKNDTFPIDAEIVSELDNSVWNVRAVGWSEDMTVQMPKNYCIKVIGEISPENKWVKEGMEFNEERVSIVWICNQHGWKDCSCKSNLSKGCVIKQKL